MKWIEWMRWIESETKPKQKKLFGYLGFWSATCCVCMCVCVHKDEAPDNQKKKKKIEWMKPKHKGLCDDCGNLDNGR